MLMYSRTLAVLGATLCMAIPAIARAEVRLLLQTDVDSPTSEELYLVSYANPNKYVAGDAFSAGFLPVGTGPLYTVAGLTEDHGVYRMLLETRNDANANELYLINYASFDDLLAGTETSAFFLPFNVGQAYTVAGFTEDHGAYRMLLEKRVDGGAFEDLYLFNYASYADFVANVIAEDIALAFNIGPHYSVGGFAHDNGAYRLLLERDEDAPNGEELYLFNYASYADFLHNVPFSDFFLPTGAGPAYSVAAFVFEQQDRGSGGGGTRGAVPEPAAWALMLLGFGSVGVSLRRRRLGARLV